MQVKSHTSNVYQYSIFGVRCVCVAVVCHTKVTSLGDSMSCKIYRVMCWVPMGMQCARKTTNILCTGKRKNERHTAFLWPVLERTNCPDQKLYGHGHHPCVLHVLFNILNYLVRVYRALGYVLRASHRNRIFNAWRYLEYLIPAVCEIDIIV